MQNILHVCWLLSTSALRVKITCIGELWCFLEICMIFPLWICCLLPVGDYLLTASSQYTEDCHSRAAGRVKAVTAESSSTSCGFSNQWSSQLPYKQWQQSDGHGCQRCWTSTDVQWTGPQRYVHKVAAWQLQVGALAWFCTGIYWCCSMCVCVCAYISFLWLLSLEALCFQGVCLSAHDYY